MTKKVLVTGYTTHQECVRALIATISEKDWLKLAGLPATGAQR